MSRILIVDDASLTREAIAKLLEHEGHSTATAANGKDAWAMLYETTLHEQTPQLIILDLMMPQMDGVMFLKLLRRHEHWGQLPVIVLTGLDDEAHLVSRAKKLGVHDIISKNGSGTEQLLLGVRQIIAEQEAQAAACASNLRMTRKRSQTPTAVAV
jgi:CheY-like chemotaxis protein